MDYVIYIRESKLDGAYKKRKGVLVKQSNHSITFCQQGAAKTQYSPSATSAKIHIQLQVTHAVEAMR